MMTLKRPDPVAGGLDDVVRTADIPEVAVLILPRKVSGVIPAIVLDVVRRFLIIQVLLEEAARLFIAVAHTDLARITDSGFRSVRSHQHDLVHRRRLAH